MTPLFHIPRGRLPGLVFAVIAAICTCAAFWALSDHFFEIDDVRSAS